MAEASSLPALPVKLDQLLSLIEKQNTTDPVELFKPYRDYDAKIRELYAQGAGSIPEGHSNAVSVFDGPALKTRARKLDTESAGEKDCYIMALDDGQRRAEGSPATVENTKEFKKNFNIFTEMSLSDLDWSNVVVAGSAALTPLLPVPEKHKESKRALREYYHETLAPASDVDLFLYALTEEQAKEKIKQIEAKVRDSILQEVTTVRTKNAITLVSSYPTRHVQIVLRIYKDISEILTGFDVDCSCVAFDGDNVWAAPRAIQAMMTQVNHIDLTRRSPSYENRLSKYSRRGFEINFSGMDRSRVDPTIFERSFMRTIGLARLLVLEKLPGSSDRDNYANMRRKERGRPEMNLWRRNLHKLKGNIKGDYEDEISDWWVDQEDVSSYETFTLPYGPRFTAKKIEKLLYSKDLLLNAEWNKPKDREVNLHRHPAFFGLADDVFGDCCGHCPKPVTDDEFEVAEKEDKLYVKGDITFMKNDPGRQQIGSFNPITDTEWTEMAYVGNTARLCAAIVDGDLEHVRAWLSQKDADPDQRDHTGRTPLQLAVSCSTPEIVQALIDADARLVARMANGYTALHLAAERGEVAIIKAILKRSERNEAEHEEKKAKKKDERKKTREAEQSAAGVETSKAEAISEASEEAEVSEEDEDEDDLEDDEDWNSEADSTSMATGSFVKVKESAGDKVEAIPEDNTDEPDFYDVNVTSWDVACSPLHLAILNGHIEAVNALVADFGADVLLPVKLLNDYDKSPRAAILTLVLALALPQEEAQSMAKTLLDLGAPSSQADLNGATALQYYVNDGPDALDFMLEANKVSATAALQHIAISKNTWNPQTNSALLTAISNSDTITCLKILENGVAPEITFKQWVQQAKNVFSEDGSRNKINNDPDHAMNLYRRGVEQPLVVAIANDLPDIALALLEAGADPNSMPRSSAELLGSSYSYRHGITVLDIVQTKLEKLQTYEDEPKDDDDDDVPLPLKTDDQYLNGLPAGSYKHWIACINVKKARERFENTMKDLKEKEAKSPEGLKEKKDAVAKALHGFKKLDAELRKRDAKTFKVLHPGVGSETAQQDAPYRRYREMKKPFEVVFKFRVGELHDELRDRYLRLFEAAWTGDLETIKELTLKPHEDQPPLKIAVQDDNLASPFSVAVMRGHLDAAEAILEICLAQFSPKEKKDNERYDLAHEDEYDEDYDSYDSEANGEDVRILRKIVDDKFTVDNIGEISLKVDSHITPLEYLGWTTSIKAKPDDDDKVKDLTDNNYLLEYAIAADNHKLFTWLLDLGRRYSTLKTENGITPSGTFYSPPTELLHKAILHGHTKMISELLKRTGNGIPFEDLVKKTGVKETESPRYYQGLSVYGKKRTDWAQAGRRAQAKASTGSPISPLLIAAKAGTLESLEFLMSDTPVRLYHEFVAENKDDKRVKRLSQAEGGIEKAITDWYYANEESLISAVVSGKASADADRRLEYLIKAHPNFMDAKSTEGESPLQLAFKLGRHSAAKILLDAGADFMSRDKAANNLIHKVLQNFSVNVENHKVEDLKAMLELLDEKTRTTLLLQRNTAASGGGTPVHNWLIAATESPRYYNHWGEDVKESTKAVEKVSDVLKTLLSLSGGKELGLINGAGDTPLHGMIIARKFVLVKLLLDQNSELLYRENATGRTPLELSHDLYTALKLKDPPSIGEPGTSSYYFGYNHANIRCLIDFDLDVFTRDKKDKRSDEEKIWDLCRKAALKYPGSRRLVSLNEANEVARRVGDLAAESKKSSRAARLSERGYVVSRDEGESKAEDVAANWLGNAVAWEKLE